MNTQLTDEQVKQKFMEFLASEYDDNKKANPNYSFMDIAFDLFCAVKDLAQKHVELVKKHESLKIIAHALADENKELKDKR